LIPRIKSVCADMMADPAYATVLPPMTALPHDEAAKLAAEVRRLAAAT
jgi:4-hydroxy-tetrahydrodipicolinate synthase